jgi:hypothetical protein
VVVVISRRRTKNGTVAGEDKRLNMDWDDDAICKQYTKDMSSGRYHSTQGRGHHNGPVDMKEWKQEVTGTVDTLLG